MCNSKHTLYVNKLLAMFSSASFNFNTYLQHYKYIKQICTNQRKLTISHHISSRICSESRDIGVWNSEWVSPSIIIPLILTLTSVSTYCSKNNANHGYLKFNTVLSPKNMQPSSLFPWGSQNGCLTSFRTVVDAQQIFLV